MNGGNSAAPSDGLPPVPRFVSDEQDDRYLLKVPRTTYDDLKDEYLALRAKAQELQSAYERLSTEAGRTTRELGQHYHAAQQAREKSHAELLAIHNIIMDRANCPEIQPGDTFCVRGVKDMAHLLNSAESKAQALQEQLAALERGVWVPVSERLPEEPECVRIVRLHGEPGSLPTQLVEYFDTRLQEEIAKRELAESRAAALQKELEAGWESRLHKIWSHAKDNPNQHADGYNKKAFAYVLSWARNYDAALSKESPDE